MKTTLLLAALSLLIVPATVRASPNTGQRLEITTNAEVKGPDAQAIVRSLVGEEADAARREVRVKVMNEGTSHTMQIEVRGATLPADSEGRIKAMFPALRDAQISLSALGHDSGGDGLPKLGPGDLDSPEKIAAFKERVQKALAARGETGTVEVTVTTGEDGKKQARVEVKATK